MGKKFNEVTAQPSTPNDTDLVLWGQAAGSGFAYKMTFTQLKAKLDSMGGTTLTAPTLSAAGIDADTIRLTIGTVANETNIEIQRSNDGTTGWSTINTAAANTTSYDDNGLAASTTRHYRVRAVGDGVTYLTSAWSSVANATTGSASSGLPHSSLFTAADGTLLTDYTPNSGNAWSNTVGQMDIQSNRATWDTLASNECRSIVDLEATQYTLTIGLEMNQPTQFASLIFRYVDSSNYMKIAMNGNDIYAYKFISGTPTLVTTLTGAYNNDAAEHEVQVVVGATTFSVIVDSVTEGTGIAIDASLSAGTRAGIEIFDSSSTPNSIVFNNFNAAA